MNLLPQVFQQIPPMWPLSSWVAINPWMGFTDQTYTQVSAQFESWVGQSIAMPKAWYLEQIQQNVIKEQDLQAAFLACAFEAKPQDWQQFQHELFKPASSIVADSLPSMWVGAKLKKDWPSLILDRIGAWAGGYYDQGQAPWGVPQDQKPWQAWKFWAMYDLTPEIQGLKNFGAYVAALPDCSSDYIQQMSQAWGLSDKALAQISFQLLNSLGGWAQYAQYQVWKNHTENDQQNHLMDLLAIRLAFEQALLAGHPELLIRWNQHCDLLGKVRYLTRNQVILSILQDAFDRAIHRQGILAQLTKKSKPIQDPPLVQAVFCMDVRSEIFRRSLENVDARIMTLGFAGFFGLPLAYQSIGSSEVQWRLPAFFKAQIQASEETNLNLNQQARFLARAKRAWGRFKLAAVSSFAFVESVGIGYGFKLLKDTFFTRQKTQNIKPKLVEELSGQQIEALANMLKTIWGNQDFAATILIVGHQSTGCNNPQLAGLQCGACGGYGGDVNALLVVNILNDVEVRKILADFGVNISDTTQFIAAVHDTATDQVSVYADEKQVPNLLNIQDSLARATQKTRQARALALPWAFAVDDIQTWANHPAQIRPEWGLAGVEALVLAPRARTYGLDLNGQAFLLDYDWQHDQAQNWLSLDALLAGPVAVAAAISWQYFASVVMPDVYGSGNKLLHNVVGGIGVLEGGQGVLRTGFAWQSVFDDEKVKHRPVRLCVCIEAPRSVLIERLKLQPSIFNLFENGWLVLCCIESAVDDIQKNSHTVWRFEAQSWTPILTE
jgi:uncharacterized protein YbcC (UPF0753/DUF2309 family)